ncbi:MAG: CehA/McbA family metallohydrolase, partial [Acidobacteriota bacterium]
VVVRAEGVYRLRASGLNGLEGMTAESNPLVVSPDGARVLWGDLQIHSGLSDGTGTPEDLYRYARDVAALDIAAITDHDHWGMLPLATHAELWQQLRGAAARFHEPGRFVTLLGYEWTNWIHGHRHVLYFEDDGDVLSAIDPRFDEPSELWQALSGRRAMTIAHHTAGEPVATNWNIAPDPALESVVEIVSVHGSSEARDAPWIVPAARDGHFVRDALDRGYRLGFIGSGDGHDGHPGLAHLGAQTGGLGAILSEELTREAVYDALRARRVYATSGPRIVLRVSLGGRRIGALLAAPSASEELVVWVAAPERLLAIDVVRSGQIVASVPGHGRRELYFRRELHELQPGEYVYVRAVQEDGAFAIASPFFLE